MKSNKKACASSHFSSCAVGQARYVGHPISTNNGLISQKLLLKSEFYYLLHVAKVVAYPCLNYEVFVTT